MAITPLPGWRVNAAGNGVEPDPNSGSAAITPPTSSPTVTPNPTGSLQNTMTSKPSAPTVLTPPTSNSSTTPASTAPGPGLDSASFLNVINGVKQNYDQNNKLIDAKNLLLKGLFTSPLTPDQIASLPPDIQKVYNSGNKDAIELQVQALNERIQGGTNNFANSVNYLVNGYQTAVQEAEQQRQDAISTVQNFVSAYGSRAGEALKSLYGSDFLDKLKSQGIDINSFAAIPTIAETKATTATVPKPPTASQYTIANYASRLSQANDVINSLTSDITSSNPLIYTAVGYLPSFLQGSERQQYEQAKRNFATAVLRKESGAAISAGEFDTVDKQYFPQPGDSAETIAQKAANRQLVINNFTTEAGSAYEAPPTTGITEDLPAEVTAKGYDYAQMKSDGYSDQEIKDALNIP